MINIIYIYIILYDIYIYWGYPLFCYMITIHDRNLCSDNQNVPTPKVAGEEKPMAECQKVCFDEERWFILGPYPMGDTPMVLKYSP